jgi:hypothetical protein
VIGGLLQHQQLFPAHRPLQQTLMAALLMLGFQVLEEQA